MTGHKKDDPPEGNSEIPMSQSEGMDFQDADLNAYMELSQELDEISNCLDALEKKNDNLHEQLFKLLKESQQIRSEMKKADEPKISADG